MFVGVFADREFIASHVPAYKTLTQTYPVQFLRQALLTTIWSDGLYIFYYFMIMITINDFIHNYIIYYLLQLEY